MAVRLERRGIAADPVRVHQDAGVAPRPARRLRQRIPVVRREQAGRDVHLLQLRPRAEVRVDLRREVALRVGVEVVRMPRVDQAV